jgi:uncharacterized membrane protein YhaH (DUF805 family)
MTKWFLNFDFSGRARRAHIWANVLTWFAVLVVLVVVGGAISSGAAGDTFGPGGLVVGGLIIAAAIASLVDGMAAVFRRAHDTNRSGWIWVLLLLPFINLLPLYWLLIQDSDVGPNRYGPLAKPFYETSVAGES